jgi:ketosteroid isomerase-like protein
MANSETQERNAELTRTGLAAWIAGDREKAIATFTEDVEIYVPPELGNAGTYRGIDQFLSWFQAWDDAWSSFEMSVGEIEPAGERHVIAMVRSTGVGAGSGIQVENELAWLFGVRGGQMEYLSLQPDASAARELAARRDPASAG